MTQEEKQIFLRQNILDKGYDTNSFVEFMMDKKGGEEGADVGNWTMSDLKIVVKEFISLQEKSNNQNNINKIEPSPLMNKYKNISDPLQETQPKNKSFNKYDPLSGNANNNNNQNPNQKNSSIKDFFVNQNNQSINQNNNQILYNNLNTINNLNYNNQNVQMNQQQMQYLQQYLALMKAQNPQFQNQILQYQQNLMNNYQNLNNMNNINNINNINTNNNNKNTYQNTNSQINQNKKTNNNLPPQKQNNKPPSMPEKKEEKDEIYKPPDLKENQQPPQPQQNQSEPNKPIDTKDDVDQSLSYGIITNPYEETKPTEKTPLSMEENPNIQVGFPEKVEGGFFSKSYVTYLITTSCLNLKVRRRYSDFDWLRQMMQNLYMYNVIPTTPRKNKLGTDKFGEPFLQKRMRTLEKFLNYSLMNPIIKSSQLFYDFISIEKDTDFQKKKKEYEKMKASIYIYDYQMPNGKANIQICKKKVICFENIKDNININENLLTKLNENLKMLKMQLDNICLKIDEIAQNWDDLCQNSLKYFDGDEISKTYEHMNKLFSRWSECLKRHSNLIHVDIREYFKYARNNFKSMKDLVYLVDTNKNTYTKNERNLESRKEDLFKRGDTNRWELNPDDKNNVNNLVQDKSKALLKILPKETSNVISMKKVYGFYLNRIIEEYGRIKNINSEYHKKNIISTCIKLIEIYGDFQKWTADIMNFFNNEENFENKGENTNFEE